MKFISVFFLESRGKKEIVKNLLEFKAEGKKRGAI